jgi:hypothetical protein
MEWKSEASPASSNSDRRPRRLLPQEQNLDSRTAAQPQVDRRAAAITDQRPIGTAPRLRSKRSQAARSPLGLTHTDRSRFCDSLLSRCPVGSFVGRLTPPRVTRADLAGHCPCGASEEQGRGRTQRDTVGKRGLAFQDRCLQPLGHHARRKAMTSPDGPASRSTFRTASARRAPG